MNRLKTMMALGLGLIARAASAQSSCGTDAVWNQAIQKDPSLKAKAEAFLQQASSGGNQIGQRASTYVIPVVFHVIHTGGPENISRAQILDQIRILNADYSLSNWNKGKIRSQFTSRAADCQIQFKLATIDPNGNCTEGINRVYSTLGVNVDQDVEEVKDLISWDTKKYLNVWVVQSIQSTIAGGTTLGYAHFPWMSTGSHNGIVVRHDRIGSIGTGLATGDSGRTCTHEIGHWLGLFHTFQDGCTGTGDGCADTPPVASAFTNASCPANGNSCTNDKPDMPDLWEDYMDYSAGACMAMFTANQKTLMQNAIANYRSVLVSNANLIATGVSLNSNTPVANFTSSARIVCAGSPVTFYDISCKSAVTARSWTFTGAASPSSTAQNPVVTYQTAGQYKVSLTVQNGSNSTSKSVDNYITVVSPSTAQYPNFEEGFENGDPAGHGFRSVSPTPWQVANGTAYTGTHCFKAPVTTSDSVGKVYSFVTPPVDLSRLSSTGRLTFYVGYALRDSAHTEVLRVYASTDCGNSWQQIFERDGTVLKYNGSGYIPNFTPSQSSHWKRQGPTSLTSYGLNAYNITIFKIDVISGGGNPVYVDNINISEWYAGTQTIDKDKLEMAVYPNPVKDESTIELDVKQATSGTVELFDMAGRKVADIYSGKFSQGVNKLKINNYGYSAGSIFVVRITTPDGQISKAVTFAP